MGERDDTRAYARFSDLRGRVLDIGCGPQAMPSYAAEFDGEFVGIDPLLGAQPREFEFVKGLAEYLPFVDGCFDRVLFGTSIDHLLSPQMSILSAARVIRPGGAVSVWHGEADPQPTRSDHVKHSLHALASGRLKGFGGELKQALRRKPKRTEVETLFGNARVRDSQGSGRSVSLRASDCGEGARLVGGRRAGGRRGESPVRRQLLHPGAASSIAGRGFISSGRGSPFQT